MPSERKQTNVRLSDEGRRLLEAVADMYGIDFTDVIEIALRHYARELHLWTPPSERKTK